MGSSWPCDALKMAIVKFSMKETSPERGVKEKPLTSKFDLIIGPITIRSSLSTQNPNTIQGVKQRSKLPISHCVYLDHFSKGFMTPDFAV